MVILVYRFMEIIPLIHLKKRKIVTEEEEKGLSINEILEQVYKDEKIYVLDIDGIDKNKPNLCLYPKLLENHKIWIDAGPRVLGDVVDSIMSGANKITIRQKIWPEPDLSSIKEITECKIYVGIDSENQNMQRIEFFLLNNIDGLVIFKNKNKIETDFKYGSYLKNLCLKYKIFAYDPNPKNFSYWETLGVAGLLVDIGKTKEFKRNEY
ncbi:MAG: hypothetical protein JSW06_09905 [Thermoplasmatales archaeon]|nr:MAG: hypothetical protein JSW06_09905 [Thermoplasmatales archaeon]